MHGKYTYGGGCGSISDARMSALGDEHPDFSGPGYTAAKQMLIVIGPEDGSSDQLTEPLDILADIAGKLDDLGVPGEVVTRMQEAVAALAGPTSSDPDDETDRLTEGDPMD
jgi:hypothetical protein